MTSFAVELPSKAFALQINASVLRGHQNVFYDNRQCVRLHARGTLFPKAEFR